MGKKASNLIIMTESGKVPEAMIVCYERDDGDGAICRMNGSGQKIFAMFSQICEGMFKSFPYLMVTEAFARGMRDAEAEKIKNSAPDLPDALKKIMEALEDDDDDTED